MEQLENAQSEPSAYLQYLPGIYREYDFIGRFLRIFENILTPIEGVVNNMPFYFDPGTVPESFLPWLGSWVGMVMDERWPEARRRLLIKSAADLYQWRGTRRGLTEFLRIYTGVIPQIIEPPQPGLAPRKQDETQFIQPAKIVTGEQKPNCFTVVLNLPGSTHVDQEIVRSIIETEKPAHAAYVLKINS